MRSIVAGVQTALERFAWGTDLPVTLLYFPGLSLRWTNYPRSHTWEGDTYTSEAASGFTVTDLTENLDGSIPVSRIQINCLDGTEQARFWADTLRGEDVLVTGILSTSVDGTGGIIFPEQRWTVDTDAATDTGVIATNSAGAASNVQVPGINTREYGCQWLYGPDAVTKGVVSRCPYRGALASCDRTYDGPNGCKAHFLPVTFTNSKHVTETVEQAKPFGGFLSGQPDVVRAT